jgi:hypothetical protein
MTNSPLADVITRTQSRINKTCVEYVKFLHRQTEPHKLSASREVPAGHQESRA